MNNEIKEILENVKKCCDITKDQSFTVYQRQDILKLLDCITNLQEIAEEHKNCTRKHWQQKCAEHCANEMIYKSRNEKAIEILEQDKASASFNTAERIAINILKGDKDE